MKNAKLRCQNCGSEIKKYKPNSYTRCEFCNSTLFVSNDLYVLRHYFSEILLDKDTLLNRIVGWFKKFNITIEKEKFNLTRITTDYVDVPVWYIDRKVGADMVIPEDNPLISFLPEDVRIGKIIDVYEKVDDVKKPIYDVEFDKLLKEFVKTENLNVDQINQISLVHVPMKILNIDLPDKNTINIVLNLTTGDIYSLEEPSKAVFQFKGKYAKYTAISFVALTLVAILLPGFFKIIGIAIVDYVLYYYIKERLRNA